MFRIIFKGYRQTTFKIVPTRRLNTLKHLTHRANNMINVNDNN